jgi:hypothetical protein
MPPESYDSGGILSNDISYFAALTRKLTKETLAVNQLPFDKLQVETVKWSLTIRFIADKLNP